MLGYSREEYVGKPIASFHLDEKLIEDILARLASGQSIAECEAPVRHRDGSTRWLQINSNVLWRDGKFVSTRCFSRDVTAIRNAASERDQLLQREREAREEAERARKVAENARRSAEAANRVKSEFLAVMSHELRTPLNAIGGYAELMELGVHGPLSSAQRDSLDRIQKNQRHLLGLINQVLNYTRLETGNLRYEIADVSLDGALGTIEALVFPQLSAKSIKYVYDRCDPGITVRADAEKLQQILLNLMTNAVKFTNDSGRITVSVEADEESARVKVADTGIGIPADKHSKIFDPFVQVDPNYTRTHEGVGLGLAISRDLARGMDAELDVESVEGTGSTFILTLSR
jgi:signal transduction histidine kinase